MDPGLRRMSNPTAPSPKPRPMRWKMPTPPAFPPGFSATARTPRAAGKPFPPAISRRKFWGWNRLGSGFPKRPPFLSSSATGFPNSPRLRCSGPLSTTTSPCWTNGAESPSGFWRAVSPNSAGARPGWRASACGSPWTATAVSAWPGIPGSIPRGTMLLGRPSAPFLETEPWWRAADSRARPWPPAPSGRGIFRNGCSEPTFRRGPRNSRGNFSRATASGPAALAWTTWPSAATKWATSLGLPPACGPAGGFRRVKIPRASGSFRWPSPARTARFGSGPTRATDWTAGSAAWAGSTWPPAKPAWAAATFWGRPPWKAEPGRWWKAGPASRPVAFWPWPGKRAARHRCSPWRFPPSSWAARRCPVPATGFRCAWTT